MDLDRGTLRVVESLEQTKAGLRFKSPKTDRNRAINLPAFAIEELQRLKRQQAEALLALGIRQTGQTLVCARAEGEPHQPRGLTHAFTRLICRVEGVPRIRFHDLRHSHATQLLLAGVHPKVAQGLWGIPPSLPRLISIRTSLTQCRVMQPKGWTPLFGLL